MMNLGVSSCLLGKNCRYDGSTAKDKFILSVLGNYFHLLGYCPEEKIFGTPRDSIRQVSVDKEVKLYISKSGRDVTHILQQSSRYFARKAKKDNLCGFILKSKSPTCGMERVKVYQQKNAPTQKKGTGIFALELRKVYPYLPIEEEGRLNDPWLKENFLMQVFAYNDLINFLKSNPSKKALVQFHTNYKYLIYAKSQNSYKKLGNIVANHAKKEHQIILDEYKIEFLKSINEKGSIKKTYNILLHIFGYFKKDLSKTEKKHILDTCDEYKNGIVPLIAIIKILNLYVKKLDHEYLKNQKFLNPYPKEFALRSDLRAFK